MKAATEPIRSRLQFTFNGQRTGTPQWVEDLGDGDDPGLFGPGSAVWSVHGGMSTIPAGVRALLVQALHPGALAGVHDHSRYREDPLGRLAGTIRWIFTVSYGSRADAVAASNFVLKIHERVTGSYHDRHGVSHDYAANDQDLLSWVHMAFADSFLQAALAWGEPIPGGPDAYVREWAVAGELMGVENPPRSVDEMQAQLAGFDERGVLERSGRTDDVVKFLRRPPLFPVLRAGYPVLFDGAVTTISPRFQELLGVRPTRVLPGRAATGVVLKGIGELLGPEPVAAKYARARRARLGIVDTD